MVRIRSALFKSGPPDLSWTPEIPRQAWVGSPWLPVAAPPDYMEELHRRRGHGYAGALGHREGLGWVWGNMENTAVGTTPVQRHRRVAVHGEVAWQRRNSTLASDCAHTRAGKGKLGVGEIGYLRRGLRDLRTAAGTR
jgi:hypothetical protein